MSHDTPESCQVALKEWAQVCDALGRGSQSVLIRKGGIDEGMGGFRPEKPSFWLCPTSTHQAQQGLRSGIEPRRKPDPNSIVLSTLAVVTFSAFVERLDVLESLEDFHDWTTETIASRYHYRTPGAWVLGVRVYRRRQAHTLPMAPLFSGCRSWVELPMPLPCDGMEPVLSNSDHDSLMALLRNRVSPC